MKKSNEFNKIHNIFVDQINNLNTKIQEQCKLAKQEIKNNIIEEKIKLLNIICVNEGLNFEEMKIKYLKPNERTYNTEKILFNEKSNIEENILNKITINDKQYYCETKENGTVYNDKSEKVGVYTNGNIIFD